MTKNKFHKYLIQSLKILVCFLCVIICGSSSISFSQNYASASIKDFIQNLFGVSTNQETANQMPNVYVGGIPLGFTLDCAGVVVIAVGQVHTTDGIKNTITEGYIQPGDVITKINNKDILSAKTIEDEMVAQSVRNQEVVVDISGEGFEVRTAKLLPQKDVITNKFKLGLWVRDNSAGVGTLTYIREDNLRFGALGHQVSDVDTNRVLPLRSGNIYKCNIISVAPSQKGTAGELKGLFLKNGTVVGSVDKNNQCGVFGSADESLTKVLNKKMPVAEKSQVKTGRATILCCTAGSETKAYQIEIIKATRFSKEDNKSMIIRIIDKELISKTGGIVQGMSGSPIIQNGMLVGAVTHVFVSDPTKGYGIYAETMINND